MKQTILFIFVAIVLASCQTVYILENSDIDEELDNDPSIISIDNEGKDRKERKKN